jgi:hypothetical protein
MRLLRFYPRSYRERFGESMEQTFNDICRERIAAGKGMAHFLVWVFAETSVGIIREYGASKMTQNITRRLVAWAVFVALLLIVPVLGNVYVEGWNWGPFDFVFATVLLYGSALTYELVARTGRTTAYRAAVGLAVATGLLLIWVNAAVGIIGDGPVNLMFFGVIAVGIMGAFIVRFAPRGMAQVLVAMALAQMIVPALALVVFNPTFDPGVLPVFILNAVFATLWAGSAVLFRIAARNQSPLVPGLSA